MHELKVRGIVGSVLSLFAGVAGLALMCLPMLFEPPVHSIYSVYESIFNIHNVSAILGVDAIYYTVATALMIAFALLMIVTVILSIISLIGACTNKKGLSMAVALRVIALLAAVVASLATVFLILYFIVNNYTETQFGLGTILPLAASLIGVAGSWVMPSATRLRRPVDDNTISGQENVVEHETKIEA